MREITGKNTLLITGKARGGKTTLAINLVYNYLKEHEDAKILFKTSDSSLAIINKLMVFDSKNGFKVITKDVRQNIEVNNEVTEYVGYSIIVIDGDNLTENYNNVVNSGYEGSIILIQEDVVVAEDQNIIEVLKPVDNVLMVQNSVLISEDDSINEYTYLMTVGNLDLNTLNKEVTEVQLVIKR